MGEVYRYDASPLLKSVETPEGYLLAEGYAGRAGVLAYRKDDGSTRYELIEPAELFNADSLATLARKPVTLQHPLKDGKPVTVDASNVDKFGVGDVDGLIEEERLGGFARVRVAIRRADAVASVKSGLTQGLSQGYVCDLDETPGTWNGQHYDAIQRNRRYNHLALCSLGRAGSEARLRVDSDTAIDGPAWPAQQQEKIMATIELGGKRYDQADPGLAQAVVEHLQTIKADADAARTDAATHKAQLDAAKKSYDAMCGQKEALDGEIKAAKAKIDELNEKMLANQKAMEEATKGDAIDPIKFATRVRLLSAASKIGVEKADEMDNAAIRRAIVEKHNPTLKLDDKSVDFIDGAAGLVIDSVLAADASHQDAAAAAAGLGPDGKPKVRADASKVHTDAMAEYRKNTYGV